MEKKENNRNRKTHLWKKLGIYAAVALILFAAIYYGNHHLNVTQYTYQNGKIPEEIDGCRIVVLSDLHYASFGKDNKKLLEKIGEQNPDLIAITGDFVDSSLTKIKTNTAFAQALCREFPDTPVFYVTGNHECRLEEDVQEQLYDGLRSAGVRVLMNESVPVDMNGKENAFLVAGVNDGDMFRLNNEDWMANDTGNEDYFTLLLAHEPCYLDLLYRDCGADLVLAGHEHGGQLRLPVVLEQGIVSHGDGMFPEQTFGVSTSGNTTMIVSRGLGNSLLPVRTYNCPELVVVTLQSGQ